MLDILTNNTIPTDKTKVEFFKPEYFPISVAQAVAPLFF